MIKTLSGIALAFVAVGASAQASHFAGFSAGLNLNAVSTTTKLSFADGPDSFGFDGVGQQSWNGSVQAAYGFVTNPSTVVNLGATYGLGKSKAGSLNIGAGDFAFDGTFKLKNQFSLNVEPGFLINEKSLVYGKISYERAKTSASALGESLSDSIHGTGFGFGLRTMIDKTTYLQVEIKQVNYKTTRFENSFLDLKTKSSVGTVGFGLKF